MNIYYIYAYLNQKTGKPYYIGKGQDDRIDAPHKNLNIPPDPNNRVKLAESLSEQDAWNLEVKLIEQYGRKDIGTGILLNKTVGGVGGDTSMYRTYAPMSEETKRKQREAKLGKVPWNKGKKGIAHISPGNRKPRSEETKRKIREGVLATNARKKG
tara:strand:+ start:205 stop:672 length:468 start_codon:yes stop_codon:yes gene_type:complete